MQVLSLLLREMNILDNNGFDGSCFFGNKISLHEYPVFLVLSNIRGKVKISVALSAETRLCRTIILPRQSNSLAHKPYEVTRIYPPVPTPLRFLENPHVT